MFESVVANLLNSYFGKYIQNLDASNLNVSILQGDAEFTDLQLRPEALSQLDLPIEVKAGYVGHLKLDIPWMRLFTSNIHLSLEDVYILAGPITDRQYDPERERLLQNAIKRQKLEALEKSTLDEVVEKTEEEPGFYEKLATHFVSRIQVSIRNIHIRYEDTVTNADHPFACGLMLKQIAMQSTDSRWEPLKTDTTSSMLHKLLRLEDLSIYWNPYIPEPHLVKSRLNTDGWRNLLRMSIDSHSIFQEDFDFIIEPVTAQARLIISTENNSLPKVFADFTLEEIEILLSRQQFLNLLTLKESFQMMSINQRYRKYHPNVPLKVSPRSWWHYAYTAILEEVIRPFSWARIKEHRSQYKKYKDLYKKSLERPDHESIRSKLWELEENLDVANILLAREHAKVEFTREAPERAKRRPKREKGWFSSWFGANDEDEDIEITGLEEKDWLDQLSNEEKQKLYEGIGYDLNANVQSYAPEYVKHKIQVILKSCCISLVNYSKKILQISVTHLLTTWEDRPATGAFRISSNTESFSIEGASIEHELIPILTSDIGVYAPSVNQVCTLDFEMKPLYVDADYSLNLNIQPVEIVYDEHSISEVTAFFNVPHGGIDMRSAAYETLQEMAKYSRAGLQYAIEQHKTVHVALNMRSPYIVVPEFGTLHRGGNVLIADFGTLRIESELQPKDVSLEDATMSEIESRLYDQFNITVSDVKVLLADSEPIPLGWTQHFRVEPAPSSGDDWHTAQTQPDSEYHILPSVQLVIAFFNAVRPDYKQLPQQKLVASLPTLKLNISDKRLLLLMSFFRNFPVPASTSMATLGEDMVDSAIIIQPAVSVMPVLGPRKSKKLSNDDISETQLEPDVESLRMMRRSVLGLKVRVKDDGRRDRKKKPFVLSSQSSRTSAGEEVFLSASDHSDEDIEEWSDFIHIKPVDDNSFPSNSVNILLRMTLGEFVINLSKVMDKHEAPYLMFRVNRLRVDSAMTVHGYAVHATLGGVQLVDKIHVGSSGEYMEILGTSAASNLVSVMYRKVETTCPDFSDGYGGIEHALLLKFHTLSALCDQASMIYLNAFIQSIITSFHSMDMKTSTSTVISTSDLNSKDRPSLTERLTSITDEVDYLPPKSIKLNMVAKLENLSLRLCDSENSLSHIDIKGLESHVLAKATRTTVRCRLKDMSVQDCSVGALFPRILVIEDDNLFDLKFVKYNKNCEGVMIDNRRRSQALDYSIRLRVGQLQTVYLSKFYWELIRFFEPFINPEMTEAAKNAAMETVQRQVDDIQSQNVRISLNVDLRSPTILVPHDSKSIEMFMLNLGNLNIKNYFEYTNIPPDAKQEWNHIYVNLSSVRVNRVQLSLADDVCNILHNVLEPVSLKADVCMAIKPVLSDIKLDISGYLEKVKVNILAKDLQLLRGILQDNFTEGAPLPTSGIYESPTVQNLHNQLSLDTTTPVSETTRESLAEVGHKASTNFLFKFEGVTATLFEQSSPEEGSLRNSLCCMDMENINLSAISHSDGDLKVTFALTSLYIDDTRPDSDLANKRVLYCARKLQTSDELPLMSLIYKVSSDGNQKADLMVEKLRLNVSVPYAMLLYSFFQTSFQTIGDTNDYSMDSSTVYAPPVTAAPTTTLSVYGSLKQPEIVLYADPCIYDSRVVVLYADIAFEYRTDPEKQQLWSKVSNLQMVSCFQTWDSSSKNVMLAPCTLEFTQKYLYDQGVMDIAVDVTKVNVYLSASVLKLLYDIYQMIQIPEKPTKKQTGKKESETNDVKNLWKVKSVKNQRWLQDREDYGDMAGALLSPETPKEVIRIKVEEINAMFEVENLDQHVPMLCVRTYLEGKISDRLTKFHVEAELHLEMYFFNEKLSVWEPLIEPVCEKEGMYRPWEVLVKIIKAKGFPMTCTYEDTDVDVPDGLQNEVQNMMHRARVKSSSSETDTDSSTDMTVIRQRSLRRLRHGSDRSFESLSHHSSIQGESDSEPEGFIHNITNKLGSIFSSDSSDADISETEEADDIFDPSLDKPVFITSRGPVHVSTGVHGFDEPDAALNEDEDDIPTCLYLMVDSEDKMQLNVTPQAISVLRDILQALTSPASSDLSNMKSMPAFEVKNKLGVNCYITLHPEVKIHKEHVHNVTILRAGENKMTSNIDDEDDIEIIQDDEIITKHDTPDSQGFVERALADAGHTLVSAGAFVFDDDDDYLSGDMVDKQRLKLQVDGFDPRPSLLHKRACRRLLPLTPIKSEDMEIENGTRYCVVLDIDMGHGRKIISLMSPLQVQNSLTMSLDVYCKTEDLKKYKSTRPLASNMDYTRLITLNPQDVYCLPMFVAFHCPLFVKPADIRYELSNNPVWWQDLMQAKEKTKHFMCMSQNEEEKKSFNFKVLCKEGAPLYPPQSVPRTIPYYTISFCPPVTLHNYLPYDLQFSLEGTGSSSSLTHGESTCLYTVDLHNTFRLLITITDYIGCDWTGSLDVTPEMEEFKAISMETDIDMENVNKHLSLSIHCNQNQSLDLYIYSPYWIINKTELPLQLRGSMSDALFECSTSTNPLLFRYKKHKRKKSKLRVYDSKWSQSFSLDTIGSCGVVVCHDKERRRKYMFMVQSEMSNLKLSKIITILPFFLVINCTKQKLRFMEENEDADLWFDLALGECQPFWPTTDSYSMYVKYETSNVTSQHFPIKKPHNTVLRMDQGTALCVEVSGGTDSPITVVFTNYSHGDSPCRVENLCEDVFIKIHQKNQSQVTLLSSSQSVLYTWDEPMAERTLMWNVYGRKKPSFPAYINKDGCGEVRLRVQSLRNAGGLMDVTDTIDTMESSPDDESDEMDGLLPKLDKSLMGRTRTDKMVIYWVSYLDGLQRVLLFTQDERISNAVRRAHVQSVDLPSSKGVIKMSEGEQATLCTFISLDGVCVSVINQACQEVALLSVACSPAMWEVEVNNRWKILNVELATWLEDQWRNEQDRANLQDQIEADLVRMQMSKPFMGALRRTHNPGVWFQYRHSQHHMSVYSRIQRLQIDNQLTDAYFPTVLCPAPIPQYVLRRTGPKPFIELNVMRRTVPEHNIDTFRYVKVLVQEFSIRVDKGFMLSLFDVFSSLQSTPLESLQLHSDLLVAQRSLQEVAAVMVAARPQRIYLEYLHLSPLKMRVSFSLNGTPHLMSQKRTTITSDIVGFFLNSVGSTFTEIKDVELKMGFFQRRGCLLSYNQLLAQIRSHYTQQALQQAYVLILGLDVLGNPYGLVRDFTQGLGDFFYEPFLGSIQGSDEFVEGLSRGVHSLMGNTVGGVTGSIALVTGSLGNALAALSFDSDYKRKRRSRLQQHPRSLPATILVAGRSMVLGVCLGFSGLVLDPIKGAHEEGVEGFFKGVGKGILGLLTKPTGGIVDMVSMAFDGLRRAAETEDGVVARMRLPRFINSDMGVKPFSAYKAAGNRLLHTICKGEYAKSDKYWAHIPLSKEERADILMITDRHLLVLEKRRFWGGWDVEMKIIIDQILGVPAINGNKLVFKVKQNDTSVNLFTGSEAEIHSPEPEILVWVQKQIENVIQYRQQ